MPDKKEKPTFEQALKSLKDAVCDLTSLEVQTYTGTLEVTISEEGKPEDFEEILKKAKAGGKLKLAYVTKINFDGDGIVLVPETPLPDYIQQAHSAAIKAGQDVRQGLLTLFSDIIGLGMKVGKP